MSFWPADTAGQVADILAAVSAAVAAWSGIVARIRGSAADKAAKAADQAVSELKKEFHRRDLLPSEANKYQQMYRTLVPFLSKPTPPSILAQQLGELRGMSNVLDTYLYEAEKGTLRHLLRRLDFIEKEPTAPNHLQALLGYMATLSVELDTIVEKEKWNRPS